MASLHQVVRYYAGDQRMEKEKEQEKKETKIFEGQIKAPYYSHISKCTQPRGIQESFGWFEADWKRQTFICTGREEESMR